MKDLPELSRFVRSRWILYSTGAITGFLIYALLGWALPATGPSTSHAMESDLQVVLPPGQGGRLGWILAGGAAQAQAGVESNNTPNDAAPDAADQCQATRLLPSPDQTWFAIQLNCEGGGYIELLNTATGQRATLGEAEGNENELIEWTAQNELVMLSHGIVRDGDVAFRVQPSSQQAVKINVPGSTYDLSFSPDGSRMIYSTTRGLGHGSETWLANADGHDPVLLFSDPQAVVVFPRWSPDGSHLAFMRMPDGVEPFPSGQLWLADGTGQNPVLIGPADTGRGFRPMWSPDGGRLAYLVRENPDDHAADITFERLVSNVYIVDMADGIVRNVSNMDGARIEQPFWSPDGRQLAFSGTQNASRELWLADLADGSVETVPGSIDQILAPVWVSPEGSGETK